MGLKIVEVSVFLVKEMEETPDDEAKAYVKKEIEKIPKVKRVIPSHTRFTLLEDDPGDVR